MLANLVGNHGSTDSTDGAKFCLSKKDITYLYSHNKWSNLKLQNVYYTIMAYPSAQGILIKKWDIF